MEFRLQTAESPRSDAALFVHPVHRVIEHTDEPERVIANIRALIAPGGIAVISLPNRLSLPYVTAWLSYRLRCRPRNQDFERHLQFPSFRVPGLFERRRSARVSHRRH